MGKYKILNRLFFFPGGNEINGAPAPSISSPFENDEVDNLNKIWGDAWLLRARHDRHGVHLTTHDGGHIHIQRDRVALSAQADDAALRALVMHAKENWNGSIKPGANNKNLEQMARVWAHCQVHGVKCGWTPPAEMMPSLNKLVEQLNYQEYNIETGRATVAYGHDGLIYRPPVLPVAPIPYKGQPDNQVSYKGTIFDNSNSKPQPISLRSLDPNLDEANRDYRRERARYVEARDAGLIKAHQIDDFGMRVRMATADRFEARMRAAQQARPLPSLTR